MALGAERGMAKGVTVQPFKRLCQILTFFLMKYQIFTLFKFFPDAACFTEDSMAQFSLGGITVASVGFSWSPCNQAKIVLLSHIFFFLTSHSSIVRAFNTCSKPAIAAWSAFVVHLQGVTFLFSRHKSPDGNVIFHSWVAFNTQLKAEWKNLALLLKLLSVNNYMS